MFTLTVDKPDSRSLLQTFLITLLFCLPFCGSAELFLFLGIGQLLFILLVSVILPSALIGLFKSVKNNCPWLFYLFLLWLASSSVSLLIRLGGSELPHIQTLASAGRHFYLLLEVSYAIALIVLMRSSMIDSSRLLTVLVIGSVCMVVFHSYAFVYGPIPDSWGWFFNPPLAGHTRDIGNIVAAALAVAVTLYFIRQQAYLVIVFILFTYLVWTGGRTAIIACIMMSAIIAAFRLLFSCRKSPLRLLSFVACLLLSLFIAETLVVFDWNGIARITDTINAMSVASSLSDSFNAHSTGRAGMWSLTLSNLEGNWLFGLGPYSYYYMPGRIYGDQPHNIFIQMLVEWGVIGLALTMSLMLLTAVGVIRRLKSAFIKGDAGYVSAAAVVFTLTLISLTSGTYFNYQPVFILCTAYAVLLEEYLKTAETKTAA